MKKNYFNIGMYDSLFNNKIMERGLELYLSNKITNFSKDGNVYSCKIHGTNNYDIFIKFNGAKIEKCGCTCPFFKNGSNCKHIYALLVKVKWKYGFNNLPKIIDSEIKVMKKLLKKFYKKYNKINVKNLGVFEFDLENIRVDIRTIECLFNSTIELSNPSIVSNFFALKRIIFLKGWAMKRLKMFDKVLIEIGKERRYASEQKKDNLISGLNILETVNYFLTLIDNVLTGINDDIDLEAEYERYRNVIIDNNLYEGKMYEDLYHELNGESEPNF